MKKRHVVLVELTFDSLTPASHAENLIERLIRHPALTQCDVDAAAEVGSAARVAAYQIKATGLD